jgi:hypothetical protein
VNGNMNTKNSSEDSLYQMKITKVKVNKITLK